jgi:putative acetyltransferase
VEATTGLTIRLAMEHDTANIHRVFVSSIRAIDPAYYSESQKQAWVEAVLPDSWGTRLLEYEFKVAALNDEIVGFVSWSETDIEHVYVGGEHGKKGIGNQLMQAALDYFGHDEICLTASLNAVDFYKKLGFVEDECLIKQRGGIDIPCIRMRKPTVLIST